MRASVSSSVYGSGRSAGCGARRGLRFLGGGGESLSARAARAARAVMSGCRVRESRRGRMRSGRVAS